MLTLHNVTKRYGRTLAVDNLSLEVRPGEVFGLVGPNGAGKTTTVSMAVGLLPPDAGDVRIGQLGSPMDPDVRRRLGMAPQSLAVYDDLTGAENLVFFGRLYGLTGPALAAAAERALAFVGLTDRGNDRASAFRRDEAAAQPGRRRSARSRARAPG